MSSPNSAGLSRGCTRASYNQSPVYNVMNQADIGVPGKLVNKAEDKALSGWKPICHMDGHLANIWLHYPSDEEKAADPNLDGFTDSLPQVILGDFGLALEEHNDRLDWLGRDKNPDLPEAETLRDKADLSRTVKQLLLAAVPEHEKHPFGERRPARLGFHSPLIHPVPLAHYSQELVDSVRRFETLTTMADSAHWYTNLDKSRPADWATFPPNDWVYGTLLAMADARCPA